MVGFTTLLRLQTTFDSWYLHLAYHRCHLIIAAISCYSKHSSPGWSLHHQVMWVKQCHKPSPSHHHFYRWCKPFPVMGGKNGIVLHTLNSCKINIHLAHGVFTTIFAVQIPVYCTHTPSVSTRLRLIFLILFHVIRHPLVSTGINYLSAKKTCNSLRNKHLRWPDRYQ